MGFFGAFLSSFAQGAAVLALDAAAALLGGQKPEHQQQLKNKAFRSDAHGTPWPRCRGRVRLQGKDLWGTQIQTSIWKTVGGGLFGIGSKSVYYNKYSESRFVGFGMKLGGGAAVDILRIWAAGKLLFNKVVSTGSSTGTVTVTVVGGGQQPGSQFLNITLASGASVSYNAGDLITVPGDPQPYTAQTNVSATGPGTLSVPIWPPLRVNLTGGGAVTLAMGTSSGVYDLSSFDPIPHDGSHPNGGYPCPPGGVRFYLGSDTQLPDPTIVHWLGAGNVPGYRGIVGVMLHDLQLANYGDSRPAITAEIAFDVASPIYPIVGPIASVIQHQFDSNTADQTLIPFSGTSSLFFKNPLQMLPYVWVVTGDGPSAGGGFDRFIQRVNTQTNMLEATYEDTTDTIYGPFLADSDGFIYYVRATGLNQWALFKVDGLAMTSLGNYGAPNPLELGMSDPSGLYAFDSFPSFFGNNVQVRMIAAMAVFGGINFLDRKVMYPFGIANQSGLYLVITSYDGNGTPKIQTGDITSSVNTPYGGSGAEIAGDAMCVDTNGDIWTLQKDILSRWDCQFTSGIDLQTLQPVMFPPSFARTDYNVGASVGSGGSAIYYSWGDNSIIIFGDSAIGKFDIASSSIVLTGTAVGALSVTPDIDIMGTVLVNTGEDYYFRVDTATLAVTASYNMRNWFSGSGPARGTYDQTTDSVWYNFAGGLYRAYLDRGSGSGIALDSIVASLMTDAGYV